MRSWEKLAVAVAVPGAAILLVLLAAICLHCRRRRKLIGFVADDKLPSQTKSTKEGHRFYRSDTAGLRFHHFNPRDHGGSHHHQHHHHHHRWQVHRLGSDFSWSYHPALVAEAAEGGWSRFAFIGWSDSLPRSASLLGCVACDFGRPRLAAEVGWEVPMGSSDFMQTVRLNPGGAALDGDGSYSAARMTLPLPGPPLGGDSPSFPQEAYFEITILHLQRPQQQPQQLPHRWSKRVKDSSGEGDRRKLIPDNSFAVDLPQEPKLPAEEQSKDRSTDVTIWLGLARGGSPPEKPPGSYRGSIGFCSNGSVYLDGTKLVFESEKARWGAVNRVVGCGFDPGKKTVFFTMDSALLHVIRCNSDAFRSPLYPTLAADADAMVSVNLGQCAFRYPPANAQRTPNPCFLRPPDADPSPHIGYDDSRELFSMGRIDSQWHIFSRQLMLNGSRNHQNSTTTTNSGTDGSSTADGRGEEDKGDGSGGLAAVDIDAESDLFEISLNS